VFFFIAILFFNITIIGGILNNPVFASEYTGELPQLPEIRAAIIHDLPPFNFQDQKTGQAVGFTVDVFNRIAGKAGFRVTYIFGHTWSDLITMIKLGEVDVIPGIGISEERKAYLLFGAIINVPQISVFARSQDKTTTRLSPGIKTGAISGGIALRYAKEQVGISTIEYQGLTEGIFDLLAGRIDAFINNTEATWYLARISDIEDRIRTVGDPVATMKQAIAVSPKNSTLLNQLNRELKEYVKTDEYRNLYLKWNEKPPSYWTVRRVLIIAGLSILLTIVVFTFGHYYALIRINRSLRTSIVAQKEAQESLREREQQAKQLSLENELIAEIGRIISSTLKIDNVYERFAEKVREVIPFDRIVVNIVNMKEHTHTIKYASGDSYVGMPIGAVCSIAGSGFEEMMRIKSSLFINGKNIEEYRRRLPGLMALQKGAQLSMVAPLISRNEVIGALALHSANTEAYSENDLRLTEKVGNQIAGAIASSELFYMQEQTENALRQSESRYRNIFENAQEGIYRALPEGRIIMANKAMANVFGYETPKEFMASITDTARQLFVNPEDWDTIIKLVNEQGFLKNYETQRFRKDGSTFWFSINMNAVRDAEGEISYYEGIGQDVTDRKQNLERMRKALGGTVQAIASLVEARDAYTAGHQRKVADLARSIATEMGLLPDQIDGLRVAATIHDIGKISVPSEILCKPRKLNDIEFSLIKSHSQRGCDILKPIDFPWPIARMVIEHHEKINGSGYPTGLTGEKLLIESRIITVADVVEAIASHRPYRPGLGIRAALGEIAENRGIIYDAKVVDACLRLFNEKGYQLPD